MTEKIKTPRYFVTLQQGNYVAKDGKTGATLFTSDDVPAGATPDEMGVIGDQAAKFLDTLYPKWREAEAYWS